MQKLKLALEQAGRQVEQDREKIICFFSKLTQCKTPSIPGDTRSAANLIKDFLNKEGLCFRETKTDPIMPNLISVINTGKPGRHLMFNGHLDVMLPETNRGGRTARGAAKLQTGKSGGVAHQT